MHPSRSVLTTILLFFVSIIYAQQPRLILPQGHMFQVKNAFFSQKDQYIITYSENVKLWEATTGRLLRSYDHREQPSDAILLPDGRMVIAYPDSIRIWDIHKDKLVKTISGNGFSILRDDKRMLVFEFDDNNPIRNKKTRLLSLNNYQLLHEFEEPIVGDGSEKSRFIGVDIGKVTIYDSLYRTIYQTKEGNLAGVSSNLEYLALQKDTTLEIIHTLRNQVLQVFNTGPYNTYSARFIPDSQVVVFKVVPQHAEGGYLSQSDNAYFLTVSMKDYKPIHRFPEQKGNMEGWETTKSLIAVTATDSTLRIWNIHSGKLVSEIKDSTGYSKNLSFSDDLKYVIASSNSTAAKVWDINARKLHFQLEENTSYINTLKFSGDGRLALIERNDDVWLWDTEKGKPVLSRPAEKDREVNVCRVDSAGERLFISTQLKTITKLGKANSFTIDLDEDKQHQLLVYGVNEGRLVKTVRLPFAFKRYWIDATGERVFIASSDSTAYLMDAVSANTIKKISNLPSSVWYAQFIPGGRQLAVATDASFIIYTLPGLERVYESSERSSISGCNYDPATGTVVLVLNDQRIVVRNTRTKLEQVIPDFEIQGKNWGYSEHFNILFDKTGRFATVTGMKENAVTIIETATGTVYAQLTMPVYPSKLFFTGNNTLAVTGTNGLLQEWDIAAKKIIRSATYEAEFIDDWQPAGKFLLGHTRAGIQVMDIKTGKTYYQVYPLPNSNYIVTDQQNRFDGTEAARKLLYFTCGTELIELDQLKDQLWVPYLAERLVNGETIHTKTLAELNICGLTPQTEALAADNNTYRFRVLPRSGGLGETALFVNGIEVKRYKPAQLINNKGSYELKVDKQELAAFFTNGQENKVTIKAYTADNTLSSRGLIVKEKEQQSSTARPNLYAVMVGVSDYKGTELDLKYAAKDATDLSAALAAASRKLLNTDGKEHVFMYNLTTSADRYLLPEKAAIKKTLEEIGKKATPNDILLVFFAGHGVAESSKQQFYFLTADASNATATAGIADAGISTAELTDWIKPASIRAQKRVLIFDACNSGQAIKDFVKLGSGDQQYVAARDDAKSQQVKAIEKLNERSGLFILAASASDQKAYEMGRYSQGLLTYSLLRAIKQQPDILEDGRYLNISRWFGAAEKTVADLSKESGARQQPQVVSNTNFNIGLVDGDVLAGIRLSQEKPLFAASNFQNNDETIADDDLELSKLINLKLSDMATRGTGSNIVYVTTTNDPGAYSLGGRYTVTGNVITVTVNLRQNKQVKAKFEVSGSKDKADDLAATIAAKAAALAK